MWKCLRGYQNIHHKTSSLDQPDKRKTLHVAHRRRRLILGGTVGARKQKTKRTRYPTWVETSKERYSQIEKVSGHWYSHYENYDSTSNIIQQIGSWRQIPINTFWPVDSKWSICKIDGITPIVWYRVCTSKGHQKICVCRPPWTHLVPDESPLATDFLNEEFMTIEVQKRWQMYFDGASTSPTEEKQEDFQYSKARTGIVFFPWTTWFYHTFLLYKGIVLGTWQSTR